MTYDSAWRPVPRGGVLAETGADVAARTRAAWGHRPPDTLLRGATVLVPSGEWARRDIAVVGDRIALVAEDLCAPGERVVDLRGKTVVPGYVEPHAHTLGPLSVSAYCGAVLARGVSCVVSDDSFAYTFVAPSSYSRLLNVSRRMPFVLRWSLRLETPRTIPYRLVEALLERDDVVQIGEVMTRQALVEPTADLCTLLAAVRSRGLRAEGHSPGASEATLQAGAAAGLSADHEARRGEEILRRLRAGLWAFVRQTDLLRDARAIVGEMLEAGISFERIAFTSDWSLPPWIATEGTIDAVIAEALAAGLPAAEAYACATLRAALYEGLDHQLGAVAPGRVASLNVLADPELPTPERVFSLGREVARDGELLVEVPDIEWSRLEAPPWTERTAGPPAEAYGLRPEDPAIFLEAASMIRPGEGPGGEPIAAVAIHEATMTMTRARAFGFPSALEGFASTLTPRRLLVALGGDPAAVACCVDAVVGDGGGIAIRHGGELLRLPLPYGGAITPAPLARVEEFWRSVRAVFADLGSDLRDPISTMLYIGSSGLPGARFAQEGLIDTRAGRTISPASFVPWKDHRCGQPTNRLSSKVGQSGRNDGDEREGMNGGAG
ncbi:MAG TPA: adenine deaminase C-terminal domain-containing protein [Solirubrobacterales bacterium]|nr:adenine deaminase C-terminal domain-containing protein [Solirubrobacterales bacterium]